ncbi:hypothetical protein S479_22420 [Salmonella enterica subsp. enterica serovar Newport]|nr:hypothetical protein [Salmonella enterica subsp. enterica serovar Newport]
MKLYFILIFIFIVSDVNSATKINKTLLINATIPVSKVTNYNINVVLSQTPNFRLQWSEKNESFDDVNIGFIMAIDSPLNNINKLSYKIGVRSLFLACNSQIRKSIYNGIDSTGKTGYKNVQLIQSDSTYEIISSNAKDDVSSNPNYNYATLDPSTNKDAIGSSGSIKIKFPILSNELKDGGANCYGGAVLIFYGAI